MCFLNSFLPGSGTNNSESRKKFLIRIHNTAIKAYKKHVRVPKTFVLNYWLRNTRDWADLKKLVSGAQSPCSQSCKNGRDMHLRVRKEARVIPKSNTGTWKLKKIICFKNLQRFESNIREAWPSFQVHILCFWNFQVSETENWGSGVCVINWTSMAPQDDYEYQIRVFWCASLWSETGFIIVKYCILITSIL